MTRKLEVSQGERYGRLVISHEVQSPVKGHRMFVCNCDCGSTVTARLNGLRTGNTKSCGCLMRERTATINRTHGGTGTRTHARWKSMMARATNPNIVGAKHYSLRGITVCERWRQYENFLADMGECPINHTLDRIDNDQGYQPGNCRWATVQEQGRNKRRHSSTGVQQLPSGNWRAFISTDQCRNKHIGTFPTMEQAIAARREAERKYWGT